MLTWPRWLPFAPLASATAGFLGAGLIETALALGADEPGAVFETLALALGLFGATGLLVGMGLSIAGGVIRSRLPDGWRTLLEAPERDERTAGTVLATVAGLVVLAAGTTAGHVALVSRMHNQKLAAAATFGVVLIMAVPAALAALAALPITGGLVKRLGRPARLGKTGVLLGALAVGAALAALAAVGMSDWRALDFGPGKAVLAVVGFGIPHFVFWYGRKAMGPRLLPKWPRRPLQIVTVLGICALTWIGARTPEASRAFAAFEARAWGMRGALAVARKFTDRDGDGFARRFGGGDCDDGNREIFPGAEDTPGDGIDQNCEGGDATAPSEPKAPETAAVPVRRSGDSWDGNILIVSIDSLRADRLGVAGYGRPQGRSLTPNLDALAARGTYFRRAWSQAPNTPRSFPAFVTSRYPSEVAWQQKTANYSPLLPSNHTFFEDLAAAGLAPYGIFSHFYFTPERGLKKGFASWTNDGAGSIADSNKDIAAPRIVPRVIDRLEKLAKSKQRFVLWTHLFEPHSSYMTHPEYPTSLRGVDGLQEKYDFEIAYVDGWVGKLLAALETQGLSKRTAIVVFADHGEAWGEHKQYFHGTDLTEEQLRVPMIIAVPGMSPSAPDDNVAVMDLGPTLLDLVGVTPGPSFRGTSLLPRLKGEPQPPHPIFAELLPATAWPKHEVMMVQDGFKLTHKLSERRFELHNLAKDPGQKTDLSRDPGSQAVFEALRKRILAFEEGQR